MPTVFITGAARGIGLALAKAYAAGGWRVLAGVRDPAKAAALDGIAEIHRLDVEDDASVAALPAALEGEAVDLLINNAGVYGPESQPALEVGGDDFRHVLAVNTVGPVLVAQALLPALRRAKGAKVAVISSQMGALAGRGGGSVAYRASKAAVNKAAQVLAGELKGDGIAVAVLHPGWVRTDMGGAGADIDPQTSARGIKAVLDGLDLSRTGRFWNYDGRELDW
jgi:NAD(P)-dependent dehydrogenase (short-subunit alcohol dehydrogenase family)